MELKERILKVLKENGQLATYQIRALAKVGYKKVLDSTLEELLKENKTCIVINPGDDNDLVKKILESRDDLGKLARISEAGYDLYKEQLTSKILAADVLKNIL